MDFYIFENGEKVVRSKTKDHDGIVYMATGSKKHFPNNEIKICIADSKGNITQIIEEKNWNDLHERTLKNAESLARIAKQNRYKTK